MLQQHYLGPESAEIGADLRCSALIGRTILQALAMLPLMSREATLKALEGEVEHLTVTDYAAAERAFKSLHDTRALLSRALDDVRMADEISCAIVCAADAVKARD
jgi:hypothetical protein